MSRLLAVAVGAVVVLGGVFLLAQLFVSRDDAGVGTQADAAGPGMLEPDRGAAHGSPAPPRSGGSVPTSGPHRPALVTQDARALSDDEILHALELGNVVLTYSGSRPPAELRALQEEIGGAFDAELAAAGQSVILAQADDQEALAWRRRLEVSGPDDPALRDFVDAWLGKGASG